MAETRRHAMLVALCGLLLAPGCAVGTASFGNGGYGVGSGSYSGIWGAMPGGMGPSGVPRGGLVVGPSGAIVAPQPIYEIPRARENEEAREAEIEADLDRALSGDDDPLDPL